MPLSSGAYRQPDVPVSALFTAFPSIKSGRAVLSQRLHAAGMTSVQQNPAAATIARDQPRRTIPASSYAIPSCLVP